MNAFQDLEAAELSTQRARDRMPWEGVKLHLQIALDSLRAARLAAEAYMREQQAAERKAFAAQRRGNDGDV